MSGIGEQNTGIEIVTESLQLLQVYAPSEVLSDADATLGLTVLNDFLDDLSNQSLATFTILEQSFPLVPGKQSYTIGLTGGADLAMARPLRVLDGPGTAYVQDANQNNYSVKVVPRDQWNLYGNRGIQIQSDFPDTLFYDPQYPLGVINVLPVPTIAYNIFFDSYLQFSDFMGLTAKSSLPPGYMRMIKTNLAVCLKPYFKAAQIDPLIILEAKERLGNIKRTNMRSNVAVMDPELVSRSQISYNPYTDKSGSNS